MKPFNQLFRGACLSVSLLAAGAALAAGPNVLTNGDFEDGLTAWHILGPDGGSGALNYEDRYLTNPSPTGGQNFGLETWTGAAADVHIASLGIRQMVNGLVIGDTYQLTFFTNGSDFRWQGESEWWHVGFGSNDVKDGNAIHAPTGDTNYLWDRNWVRQLNATGDSIKAEYAWHKSVLTFVADDTSEMLTFRQQQNPKSDWTSTSNVPYGTPMMILLDGVSLVDLNATNPVPEPSAASLSLMGLALIGFIVSRRRKA